MRLFIFNNDVTFDLAEVVRRSRINTNTAKKELKLLESIGFIRKKNFVQEAVVGEKVKKKKAIGWIFDQKFPLALPLKRLLIDSELVGKDELPERFKDVCKLKVLVLSGIFMKDDDRKIDMLVVGEKMDKKKLEQVVRTIESEIGKELRYSVFTPEEFEYRLDMYDTLLLDIFEYPHEKVVDRIGISHG